MRRSAGFVWRIVKRKGVTSGAIHHLAMSTMTPTMLWGSEAWWTGTQHPLTTGHRVQHTSENHNGSPEVDTDAIPTLGSQDATPCAPPGHDDTTIRDTGPLKPRQSRLQNKASELHRKSHKPSEIRRGPTTSSGPHPQTHQLMTKARNHHPPSPGTDREPRNLTEQQRGRSPQTQAMGPARRKPNHPTLHRRIQESRWHNFKGVALRHGPATAGALPRSLPNRDKGGHSGRRDTRNTRRPEMPGKSRRQ